MCSTRIEKVYGVHNSALLVFGFLTGLYICIRKSRMKKNANGIKWNRNWIEFYMAELSSANALKFWLHQAKTRLAYLCMALKLGETEWISFYSISANHLEMLAFFIDGSEIESIAKTKNDVWVLTKCLKNMFESFYYQFRSRRKKLNRTTFKVYSVSLINTMFYTRVPFEVR